MRFHCPSSTKGASRPRLRILAIGLCLALTASACGGPDIGVSGEEIKLGSFAPLTGPYAALGNVGRSMAAYFEWLNAQGGIHGRTVNG